METENTLWMGDIESWMDELFIRNSFIECGFNPTKITLTRDKRFERKKIFILLILKVSKKPQMLYSF